MEQAGRLEPEWYAVHVRSRHEFQVVRRLAIKGIETFLPTMEKLKRWKDRKKMIAFPLFSGYIFVHMPRKAQEIMNVLKIRGVVRLLGSEAGRPDPIPDSQIDTLKKVLANRDEFDLYPYLNKGQKVRITKGPLSGVEGELSEKQGKQMLVLAVDVLQQGVAVKVSASEVERI